MIIGSIIRDTSEVEKKYLVFRLPVFSKGSICKKDVIQRATMESHNKTIQIIGINIPPNGLIFGDNMELLLFLKNVKKKF